MESAETASKPGMLMTPTNPLVGAGLAIAIRVIRLSDAKRTFAELAAQVSEFRCPDHGEIATLITSFGGRAGIAGCCEQLLDTVEQALIEVRKS